MMLTGSGEREDATDALLDDTEPGRVAVIRTYFDESASVSDRVLTVAGVLLNTPHSRKLNRLWKHVLDEYGLDHFHMTDCANGAPPYDVLGGPKCDQLARKLISAIRGHVEFQTAISMNVSDYAECARTVSFESGIDFLRAFGGPYSFLVQMCMHAMADYSDAKDSTEQITYYLEQGHACQSEADGILGRIYLSPEVVRRLRYYKHSFVPKFGPNGMRLLQVADVLAWEWMRDRCEQVERAHVRPRRLSLAYLLKNRLERVEHLRASEILVRQRESLAFNINVVKTVSWQKYDAGAFAELEEFVLSGKPIRGSVMMKT